LIAFLCLKQAIVERQTNAMRGKFTGDKSSHEYKEGQYYEVKRKNA